MISIAFHSSATRNDGISACFSSFRDDESIPILQLLSTHHLIHINAPRKRQHLRLLSKDIPSVPPRVGVPHQEILAHFLNQFRPVLLGGLLRLHCSSPFCLGPSDDISNEINLTLKDCWTIGKRCRGYALVSHAPMNCRNLQPTLWTVYHEGVGKPMDEHSKVTSNLIVPDVFDVNAVFTDQPHPRESAAC